MVILVAHGRTGRIITGTKMRIQAVNAYLKLVDENLAPKILCKSDKLHGRLFPELIESESGDSIDLYCLACDYRMTLGLDMYKRMFDIVWMYEFGRDVENE